jgi:hypothetical protein
MESVMNLVASIRFNCLCAALIGMLTAASAVADQPAHGPRGQHFASTGVTSIPTMDRSSIARKAGPRETVVVQPRGRELQQLVSLNPVLEISADTAAGSASECRTTHRAGPRNTIHACR